MKKYLKMTGCIFAGLLIVTILAIVGQKILKTYADTPTKEVTVSKVTYEFEAEDTNATTGIAHNIRVKSKDETNTSTNLSIPNTITVDNIKYTVDSIGNGKVSALGDTTGWVKITVPTNVTAINANAFKECTTLTTVIFSSTSKCVKIGEYAFYGCTSLSNIQGNGTNKRMPASIITIEDYAFYNCDALEELDLFTGIKTLGENTFKGTTPLTKLTIKSNIENHNNAFKGHKGITTLIFNGKLATTIYDSMFEGCTGITSVNQRTGQTDYIEYIGDRAFFGCTGLNEYKAINYGLHKNLKVGKDAYRFGGYAEGVTELPTINIEQSVDKANVEYYTNGIGKVTMDISANDKTKDSPKDYIVCIDVTGSMNDKTKSEVPDLDENGDVKTDKNGNVVMKKLSKMDIAKESLQLLANNIYDENKNNRLAVVIFGQNSYKYIDFLDGSSEENRDAVNNLISKLKTGASSGNIVDEAYGSKTKYYECAKVDGTYGTSYLIGLRTMADVIMERETERNRNVYGIFISDGYPNRSQSAIQGAASQVKGFCDAVWSVSIDLVVDEEGTEGSADTNTEADTDTEEEDNGEFEPPIDDKSQTKWLEYIRTVWGRTPLFFDFPDDGQLETNFKAFMESIVNVSTSSLSNVTFKSVLNTDLWEFYTGTEYINSEGCDITDSQNATFKIDRVGKDKKEYNYYIRLKDDKRDKTDPQLLVSNELTAEYTISGGTHNGEEYNKENGNNALYDTPLYLDWKTGDVPLPPDNLRPGKLEIAKTGEVLIKTEQKEDGTITPIYEEVRIQGAEFEVYAKEDIYIKENNGGISTQADEIDTGGTETPEEPGGTETPEEPGGTETPEQPEGTETKLLYAKDTLIKRILTDEDGKAVLENLPIGKYYVKEVKAGQGFVLNQDIKEFEIVNQGSDKTIQKVEIAYKNERQKINLDGKKGLIVEKIANKKLYKPGEEVIYTIRITNTTQEVIKRILVKETMIQGKFEDISTDNVVKGDDTTVGIRELKPGESVELKFISNSGLVTEKEKIVNKVEATGVIEEPDPENPENKIEKEIKGDDEEEIYVSDKQLNIIKEALKEEYEVGETVQYVIRVVNNGLTDITDVVVEEKMLNGQFVYVEEANQGGADVTLVDNQKVTISKIKAGQMITLKYEYEITKDTKVILDDNQRIMLENKVTVKGKTEEPDPIDPENPTTPKDLEDEDTEEIEIKTNSEGGLGIIKIDIETGKAIQGAIIGLYTAENIKGSNGEDIIARDTLIEKATTDEQGKAKYSVDLPLGKYYLKEIEAPEKYMLSEEKTEIDATYRGQEIESINVSKTITNRKTALDFSVDKTLSSISVDGESIPIKNDKLSKLEIKSGNIDKANVIVTYKIKVKNKVNIAGTTKVLEIIPRGYEVINAPEYWTTRPDGTLETEVSLEGNESKELEITLKWMNGESNLGERINVAKLETDGDTNTDDDESQATVIISVKTGEIVSAIIIIMIIVSLGISGYITTLIISKMGKGPDIEGINFLKNKNK